MYPTKFDKNDIRKNDVVRFDRTAAGSVYGIVDRVTGKEERFPDHIRVVTFEKTEGPGLYRRNEVERVNRFRVDDGTTLRYFSASGTEATLSDVRFQDGRIEFKTTWASAPQASFWNTEEGLSSLVTDISETTTQEVKVAGAQAHTIIVDERTTTDIYDMAGPLKVGDIVSLDQYIDRVGVVDAVLPTRPGTAYRVNVKGLCRLVHRDNLTRLNKVRPDNHSTHTRKIRETGKPVLVCGVTHDPTLGIIYDCIWYGQARKVEQTVLLDRTVAVPKPAPALPPKEAANVTKSPKFKVGDKVHKTNGDHFWASDMDIFGSSWGFMVGTIRKIKPTAFGFEYYLNENTHLYGESGLTLADNVNKEDKLMHTFKVGDKVRRKDGLPAGDRGAEVGTITKIDRPLANPNHDRIFTDTRVTQGWHFASSLELDTPKTEEGTFIVAKVETFGSSRSIAPASRPAIHLTREKAEAEAERLSKAHAGSEFGVFKLVSLSETEKPVTPVTSTKRID